jgi:hypothetical protein
MTATLTWLGLTFVLVLFGGATSRGVDKAPCTFVAICGCIAAGMLGGRKYDLPGWVVFVVFAAIAVDIWMNMRSSR